MSDTTKCLVEKIKAKFETIKTIVGNELHLEDIRHPKYLRALLAATESTYVTLNDGLCESLQMCRECAQRRDTLLRYMHLLDDIERGASLASSQHDTLRRYPQVIDDILERIDHVLRTL